MPSGYEHLAFPLYVSPRGDWLYITWMPLPSQSVLDTVLCSSSPCFTCITILMFIHLSSELFGLVRSSNISNWDPRTGEDFQHSLTRHTDSGCTNSSSWTPSGFVLLLDKFCILTCLLKICRAEDLQTQLVLHTSSEITEALVLWQACVGLKMKIL